MKRNCFLLLTILTVTAGSWSVWAQTERSRVTALVIDPLATDTIYAGLGAGIDFNGVYKSTNSGGRWEATGFRSWITTLAIDPADPQVIYAGTLSEGLYKSENGGVNWRPINAGLLNLAILSFALAPKRSNVIYAGTNGAGVFKSIDAGETWTPIPISP